MEEQLMDKIREIIKRIGYMLSGNTEVLKYPSQYIEQLRRKNSKAILEALKEGLLLEQEKIHYRYVVPLIDFENINNNEFSLYSSVKIEKNYYDFIITINDIPIVVIECNRDVDRGCLELQGCFFNGQEEYLKTVQLLVCIDNNSIRYKTTQKEENWKEWHLNGNQDLETIQEKIESFLNKETLLNLIQNYIIYIGETKEISTYYQYFATEEIWKSKEKNRRVYLPTGTGKTKSMLFMIEKLKKQRPNSKILIIVERLDMLEMIKEKISKSFNRNIERVNTKIELEEMLQNVSKNVLITTIQKLKSYDKEYLGELYIIADIISSYSKQVLKRMESIIFKNSILIEYMSIPQQDEDYLYYYSPVQAIQDQILTKTFYEQRRMLISDTKTLLSDTRRIEKVAENIRDELKNSFQKEKKAIIIANKEDSITYIQKIGESQEIATTSFSSKMKDSEFLQNIIRENGSFENYRDESIQNFNNGNLKVLVVSSLQELMEITTNKVDKIYLTQKLPNRMVPIIFKILSTKDLGKARGVIVDYAENRDIIASSTKEKDEEEKKAISEISSIKQEAREMFINLRISSEIEDIKKDMQTITGLNSKELLIKYELFCEKVKKWLEKVSFILASDDLSKLLEKGEAQRYKERMQQYLEIIDEIAVIYALEVKDKQLIKQWCTLLGITSFEFTPIQKSDLLEYPNLQGAWKNLTNIQKAEALKNRFKLYGLNHEKSEEEWKELEDKYKLKQINDEQYCYEIEKKRQEFLRKIQVREVPKELKNEEFATFLYNEIQAANYIGEIIIKSNEKLTNIILEIMTKIKQEVKIGWKDNFYVWKKIELGIIETIYDHMEDKEIFMTEKVLDEFLKKIKQIAIQTIDFSNNKIHEKLYYIKKKNAYAVGKFQGNDFVVLKTSITAEEISQHMSLTNIKLAEDLRKNGVIVNNQFIQDYRFSSSSAAACIILGRSANGRIEWKDNEGRTINQNEGESI